MSSCLHKQRAVPRRVFYESHERQAFPVERFRTRRAAKSGRLGKLLYFFVVFLPFSYFHEVIVDVFLLYIDALIRLLIFVYFLAIIFSPAVPASREFLVSLNYERYIFQGHKVYVYL